MLCHIEALHGRDYLSIPGPHDNPEDKQYVPAVQLVSGSSRTYKRYPASCGQRSFNTARRPIPTPAVEQISRKRYSQLSLHVVQPHNSLVRFTETSVVRQLYTL